MKRYFVKWGELDVQGFPMGFWVIDSWIPERKRRYETEWEAGYTAVWLNEREEGYSQKIKLAA